MPMENQNGKNDDNNVKNKEKESAEPQYIPMNKYSMNILAKQLQKVWIDEKEKEKNKNAVNTADTIKKDEKKEVKNRDDNRFIMKALAQFTQLGITMASCIAVGFVIGKFFDWLLGTTPWLMVLFMFVGSGAAIKILYDIGKDLK